MNPLEPFTLSLSKRESACSAISFPLAAQTATIRAPMNKKKLTTALASAALAAARPPLAVIIDRDCERPRQEDQRDERNLVRQVDAGPRAEEQNQEASYGVQRHVHHYVERVF